MRDIFSVKLIVRDKVIRQRLQNTAFEEKRIRTEVRLSAYQPNALPLGQTGSKAFQLPPNALNFKGSKERYLLGQKHSLQIFGVVRFVELQNDT